MKKILMTIILISILTSCTQQNEESQSSLLPVIDIFAKYDDEFIRSQSDMMDDNVRKTITECLREYGKGYADDIYIMRLDTDEANGMELFEVFDSYMNFRAVFIYIDGEMVSMYEGMVNDMKLFDGNMDDKYDVVMSCSVGSGIVSDYIMVFDSSTLRFETLSLREAWKNVLIKENAEGTGIEVFYSDILSGEGETETYGGRLELSDDGIEIN